MSNDVAAVKRLLTNLKTLHTKAVKATKADVALRAERTAQILGEYKTEADIQDAYGYDYITDDERVLLLAVLDGEKNPICEEMSEPEIYALELRDIIKRLSARLRDLEWDELPEEEKDRILAANAAAHESRRSIR